MAMGVKMSDLITRFLRLFQTDPLSVLIARRAERVCNRKRAEADKFIRVHMALARGKA
jgi:hypothetical protein